MPPDCGVSEVVLLKIADIDSQRMVIRSRQGKGGKDRYVMLSAAPRILRTYWRLARPKRWCSAATTSVRSYPTVLHAACVQLARRRA